MENRLLRNEHDKVIAGVSSGLAAYMQVDVTIIRLLFVLSTIFLVGTGVLVYLVMWIVVPVNDDPAARFSKFNDYFKRQQDNSGANPSSFGQSNPFNMGSASNAPDAAGSTANTAASDGPVENAETKTNYSAGWQNPVDFKTLPKNNGTGRTIGGLFLLVIGLYFLMNEFHIIPYWFRLGKLWPLAFVAIGLSFILKSKRKNKWEEWNTYTEQHTTVANEDQPKNTETSGETPKDTDTAKDQL